MGNVFDFGPFTVWSLCWLDLLRRWDLVFTANPNRGPWGPGGLAYAPWGPGGIGICSLGTWVKGLPFGGIGQLK